MKARCARLLASAFSGIRRLAPYILLGPIRSSKKVVTEQNSSSLILARGSKRGGDYAKTHYPQSGLDRLGINPCHWRGVAGLAQQTNTTDDAVFTINRVGTIDLVEVLRQSTATSSVRALLDEKRAQFQEEFAVREVDLMAREKALQSKRDVMSAAFGDEVRLFQAEVADVQREIQRKRKSLDNAFQKVQDKLRGLAIEIVGDVAEERKLDLVFNRSNVLIFRNQLDLTTIVLERLNERTKDARFEVTEVAPSKDN